MKKLPRLAGWLILVISPFDSGQNILGDITEFYNEIYSESGHLRANIWCWVQIFKSLPKFFKTTIYWSCVMFKSYFITAYRNILRQKGYAFINIFGLSIGLACCLLMTLWVQDELSYDRFHENRDDLYKVMFSNSSFATPTALSPYLESEYPEIINSSRYISLRGDMFRYEEMASMEYGGKSTDPGFLTMFTLSFLEGDPQTALDAPNSVVVSKKFAEKFFGKENVLGKSLTYSTDHEVTITGVFENYPENSHLDFEYILPVTYLTEFLDMNVWDSNSIQTFVQLQHNYDPKLVDEKISDLVTKRKPQDKRALSLFPVKDIHLYWIHGNKAIVNVRLFSVLALFILVIACINFINLTTARSAMRAREVGMRKVVGARRQDLIKQFFGESLLLTLISTLLGIVFVILCLPFFNDLTGKQFIFGSLMNERMLSLMVIITLLTGLISGSYPALVLSGFQPLKVLKNSMHASKKGSGFRKVLVVFQFSLSILLILGTLTIFQQIDFLKNRNLGYDKENIVYMSVGSRFRGKLETIRTKWLQNPNITSMTMTNMPPHRWNTNAGHGDVEWEGKAEQEVSMVFTTVDYDYLETFGLELTDGRFFARDFPTDATASFVLNEAAVKAMELENPIGKQFRIWDNEGSIIGVIKDYHFESLHRKIIPMVMKIEPNGTYYVCVRINPENLSESLNFLENEMEEIYPEYPFEYEFLDQSIQRLYQTEEEVGRIVNCFTFLALMISCLGLFGLASFITERRTKEIGIRKTLGSSTPAIVYLLSKEFLKWIVIANIIAWPIAWYAMNIWLENFAYKIDQEILTFVFSGIAAAVIALSTVIYQTIRAARSSPVDSLKYE